MQKTDLIIYHITSKAEWQQARFLRVYLTDSLKEEGFIHCSTKDQILRTANSFFRGKRDLVLLCIETDRVKSTIKYEQPEGEPWFFPHIYGPLNIEAVQKTVDFPPESDGSFKLPLELSMM